MEPEKRVARPEHRVVRHRIVATCLSVVLATLLITGAATRQKPVVRAERFEVVISDQVRAVLEAPDGYGVLRL
jgi:hypothetical protein